MSKKIKESLLSPKTVALASILGLSMAEATDIKAQDNSNNAAIFTNVMHNAQESSYFFVADKPVDLTKIEESMGKALYDDVLKAYMLNTPKVATAIFVQDNDGLIHCGFADTQNYPELAGKLKAIGFNAGNKSNNFEDYALIAKTIRKAFANCQSYDEASLPEISESLSQQGYALFYHQDSKKKKSLHIYNKDEMQKIGEILSFSAYGFGKMYLKTEDIKLAKHLQKWGKFANKYENLLNCLQKDMQSSGKVFYNNSWKYNSGQSK